MPGDQQELIDYVNSDEQDILKRRGYKSAEEIFAEKPGESRVLVLYRDQRERLQTEYVAVEEQTSPVISGAEKAAKSKWFAADMLGATREIDREQARRVLAESG